MISPTKRKANLSLPILLPLPPVPFLRASYSSCCARGSLASLASRSPQPCARLPTTSSPAGHRRCDPRQPRSRKIRAIALPRSTNTGLSLCRFPRIRQAAERAQHTLLADSVSMHRVPTRVSATFGLYGSGTIGEVEQRD